MSTTPGGRGDAYLIDAVRTVYGERDGALSAWHPVDLAAELLQGLFARNQVEPAAVGQVVLGCATQVGAQALNLARRAVLAAGWPEHVAGVTVDGQSASSAQSVHWAAASVMSGTHDLVVAGGVEVASRVPLGANLAQPAVGKPLGRRLAERYGPGRGLLPPGLAHEEVCRRWSLGRLALDAWALGSRARAARSQTSRLPYIIPLPAGLPDGPAEASPKGRRAPRTRLLTRDEALGRRASAREMARLPPAYLDGGAITAGNMAAEGDGASAALVAGLERATALGLEPVARFVSLATAGEDPAIWPAASIPATREALRRARLAPDDIDAWYVHESSAAAVLAWLAETGVAPEKLNPEGGALATTAPSGAAGAGLFATALSGLAGGSRRALVTVAGEGGVATACILERA